MPARILTIYDIVQKTTLSRSTIYRRIAKGQFPAQVVLSDNRVGWWEHEVEACLKNLAK
jgi:prophage regulatory protein